MCAVDQKYFKTDALIFRNDPEFFLRASVMEPQDVTVAHQHEFTECIFITRGEGMHQCAQMPEKKNQPGGYSDYSPRRCPLLYSMQ